MKSFSGVSGSDRNAEMKEMRDFRDRYHLSISKWCGRDGTGDISPCKVTPVILHGIVSGDTTPCRMTGVTLQSMRETRRPLRGDEGDEGLPRQVSPFSSSVLLSSLELSDT